MVAIRPKPEFLPLFNLGEPVTTGDAELVTGGMEQSRTTPRTQPDHVGSGAVSYGQFEVNLLRIPNSLFILTGSIQILSLAAVNKCKTQIGSSLLLNLTS